MNGNLVPGYLMPVAHFDIREDPMLPPPRSPKKTKGQPLAKLTLLNWLPDLGSNQGPTD